MKVKELIEELSKLDQEKGIWVAYNFPYDLFEPMPDHEADEDYLKYFKDKGVEEGDYIISAG